MKSYINVYQCDHNNIKCLYIENSEYKEETVRFKPFLGIHATKAESTSWKDMYGAPVKVKVFDSIIEMRNWKKENAIGLDILGDVTPEIQYIASNFRKEIPIQKSAMKIFNLDIEIYSHKSGFPHANLAQHPINAITIQDMVSKKYTIFSDGDYNNTDIENTTYIKCEDEIDLLKRFIQFYREEQPHILVGWNIKFFDIPYIVNRVNRILGPTWTKQLSREGIIKQKEKTDSTGKKSVTFDLIGHIIWDYMELYKKYCVEPRESFSLGYISRYELGQDKIDYSEYDNLSNLYKENFQLFIEYNKQDTTLVSELDDKLRFIDLALSMMYLTRCLPDQIFGTVKPWDSLLYNELLNKKIMCPSHKHNSKVEFPGGFVKPPNVGLHKWVVVYDIVSSYPNQIRSFNLSPETIISDRDTPRELKQLASKFMFKQCDDGNRDNDKCPTEDVEEILKYKELLERYNVCWSANGYFYKKNVEGIIPEIYTRIFNERLRLKKIAGQMKKEGNPEFRSYDLKQITLKLILNAGYGAISNENFRYFDIRLASAITTNGQTCARGVAKYLENKLSNISTIYQDTDSVRSDSIVEINNERKSIEEFFESFKDDKLTIKNKEYVFLKNAVSPCYTNQKVEQKRVKSIYRHKVSKQQYKITTETGKEIFVTNDHSIMILRNSELIEVKPKDIKNNDKVITIQK